MRDRLELSESLEDYLEAIFYIVAAKQAARAKDISVRLGVHSSSVTQALRSLAEKGLVNYAPYDVITLTAEGLRAAQGVVRRHRALRDFFVDVLAVDEAAANEDACKMEHALSPLILDRLIRYLEFVKTHPSGCVRWNDQTGYYCLARDCKP